MAYIQAAIRRAFLRQLWADAKTQAVSLYDCLMAFQKARFEPLKGGLIVIGSTGGGFSTSLRTSGLADSINQEQLLALSEEFLGLYDAIRANLTNPSDDQICAAMLADVGMQSVQAVQNDYTLTRIPGSGVFQ